MDSKNTCPWTAGRPLDIQYHDNEWGMPLHDDKKLFEFLVLETFQAGLSWSTILKKRENFRLAFDNFEAPVIANYRESKIIELMNNAGIIRNQLKIRSTISNAQLFLTIQEEWGSFDHYIWQFTKYKTIINAWKSIAEVPATSTESDIMSKALKKKGFKFVGSTICYAYMQATGMVNDHLTSCFRYHQVQE